MSSQHSDKSSSNSLPYAPGSLPPRSEKHGKKKSNIETSEEYDIQFERTEMNEAQGIEIEQEQEKENLPYEGTKAKSEIDPSLEYIEAAELDDEPKRPKSGFPLIQIILFSFLSIIAAIILIWGWNYYQNSQVDNTYVDPLDGLFRDPEEQQEEVPPEGEAPVENGETGIEEDTEQGIRPDDESPQDMEEQLREEEPEENIDGNDNQEQEEESSELDNQPEESESNLEAPAIIAVHTVQPGETFFSITMRYYESSQYRDYLAEFNEIEDQSAIYAGMQINIPEKR